MLQLGELIAISFPPAYFTFQIILKHLESISSGSEIESFLPNDKWNELHTILITNLFGDIFWEYLIISIVNGMHFILILSIPEIGVLVMIFGIALSMYGHHCLPIEKKYFYSPKKKLRISYITRIMFSTSVGIIGFYMFFENRFVITDALWIIHKIYFAFTLIIHTCPQTGEKQTNASSEEENSY